MTLSSSFYWIYSCIGASVGRSLFFIRSSSHRSHRNLSRGIRSRSNGGRNRSGGIRNRNPYGSRRGSLVLWLLLMDRMQTGLSAAIATMLRATPVFEFISICYDYLIINMRTNSICGHHLWYSSSSLSKTCFRVLIIPRHHLILNLTGQISAMIKPHIILEVIAFSQLSNAVSDLSDHLLSSFVLSHHISNTLFPNLIALPAIATVSNSPRLHICHLYIVATYQGLSK